MILGWGIGHHKRVSFSDWCWRLNFGVLNCQKDLYSYRHSSRALFQTFIQKDSLASYLIDILLEICMYVWFSSLKKDSSSLSETATYISTLTAQRMCHPLRAYCLIRCRPIRTGLWLLAIRLATRRAHRIRAQPTSSLRKPTWDQDNHHRYYNDL